MDAYVGRPGHGKSYSVVEYVIIPSLKQDRHVITNIPLFVDDLVSVYGGQITQLPLDWADDVDWASTIPNGAVLVLDEVWRRFPSGQKVTAANPDDLALFKEHRHRVDSDGNSMRIVLVTQDTSDLSSWVRKLVDHTFFMNKLSDVGASNRFRVDIYQGCPTGERLPKRSLVRSTYGAYKPEIYRYYSSATQSETGMVGDETAADGRTNVWKSAFVWLTLGGGPVVGLIGLYFVISFFTSSGSSAELSVEPRVVTPEDIGAVMQAQRLERINHHVDQGAADQVEPEPDQLPPSTTGEPGLSTTWRLAGYIGKAADMGGSQGPASPPDPLPGYPDESLGARHQLNERQPLVILHGVFGTVRYVLLSECSPYPDRIHWYCDVDGERVTPWSGQPTLSGTMAGAGRSAIGSAQSAVASGATAGGLSAGADVPVARH